MAEHKRRCERLVNDERFFEKENFTYTKTWGIDPKTGKSPNLSTEQYVTDKKTLRDPLLNGISLDLVKEKQGDVDSRMDFGENSLCKVNSIQVPSLLASTADALPTETSVSEKDLKLIVEMHNKHKVNDYTMCAYIDEQLEILTFPNLHFSRHKDRVVRMRQRFVETVGAFDTHFHKSLDQRVTFQVGDKLIETNDAYDAKTFTHTSLAENVKQNSRGDRNKIEEKNVPRQKITLHLIRMNATTNEYELVPKADITDVIKIKDRTTDTELTYEVLGRKKFFFANLAWGYKENTIFHDDDNSKLNTVKWLPLIKIVNDVNINDKVYLEYVVRPHTYALCVERFYSRYVRGDDSVNSLFNKQLVKHNHFLPHTMEELNKHLAGNADNDKILYKQIIHGKVDKDAQSDSTLYNEINRVSPVVPKFRMNRMLSAYNKTTGEVCVQFLPLIQDFLNVTNSKLTYEQWFIALLKTSEKFMAHDSPTFDNEQRKIFSLTLIDKKQNSQPKVPKWTRANMPLFNLTIHIARDHPPLHINNLVHVFIDFQYNVEKLGFDLYGSSDALYTIERFFTEYIIFHESIYEKWIKVKRTSQTLQLLYRGREHIDLLKGVWEKSRLEEKTTGSGKFGKKYRPRIVTVVNMNDDKEIRSNVRSKTLIEDLKKEHSERWKKVSKFLNANLSTRKKQSLGIDESNDFYKYDNRYRLVFFADLRDQVEFWPVPVNLALPSDSFYGHRLDEFGLDQLSSTQKTAVLKFYSDVVKLICPTTMEGNEATPLTHDIQPQSTGFEIILNSDNLPDNRMVVEKFAKSTYSILMMSGTEFDMVKYNNYIIEPCNELKEMLALNSDDITINDYKKMIDTHNYSEDKTKPKLKRHPLFDPNTGNFIGNPVKGSFWQFPMSTKDIGKISVDKYFNSQTSLFHPEKDVNAKANRIAIDIDDKSNKQFFNDHDAFRFTKKSPVVVGKVKTSSIRLEAPNFLVDAYNHRDFYYQEHGKFTINSNFQLKPGDFSKERKRQHVYDLSDVTLPQKIKKRRTADMKWHFFLVNGSRPQQVHSKDLTDIGMDGVKIAPVRNFDVTFYYPKLDKSVFEDVGKDTFLERAVVELSSGPKNSNNLNVMISIHNLYETKRRLTSVYGVDSNEEVPNIVSETLDENADFYKRLFRMWMSIIKGNAAFKANFRNISDVLSKPVKNYFTSPVNDVKPFEMRLHVEDISMPLSVENLENDDVIYVLSDLDFEANEKTNFDGAFAKKVLCVINLKNVINLDDKVKNHFVQNFTSVADPSSKDNHNSTLKSFPITVRRIHDLKSYKFYFVNSKFQPIKIKQRTNDSFAGKYIPDSVSVKVKFYITNKLSAVL